MKLRLLKEKTPVIIMRDLNCIFVTEIIGFIKKENNEKRNKMITIENKYFSIPQICESGQCFRLEYDGKDSYLLIAGKSGLRIRVTENEKQPDKAELFCSEEEFEKIWKKYFDLSTSYEMFQSLIDTEDVYLKKAAEFGRGIRILRQDTWEMIITFIISQQNNIPRIKNLINTLCREYGETEKFPDGKEYHAFPEPSALAKASEKELRALKLGYRSRYICGTAEMVSSGRFDIQRLENMDYHTARSELMKLPGVGEKVADCICLFALHKLNAFPVDTHIRKVMDKEYGGNFPLELYKECAGVMQQYIFYYDLKGAAK